MSNEIQHNICGINADKNTGASDSKRDIIDTDKIKPGIEKQKVCKGTCPNCRCHNLAKLNNNFSVDK